MLIALGFVLVMMRQASKPEIYESLIGALTPHDGGGTVIKTGSNVTSDAADTPLGDTAIDDAITAKVVDGTVWRSADFEALYLFLDEANSNLDSAGPMVGVLPLLQQPEVFRNKRVRARGRIARSQRIEAQDNDFGITEYWQLWMRPSSGADRPIVVIVQTVPDDVAAVGADATDSFGPNVTVTGRYLKRLAYRSSSGADSAPVIVGRLVAAPNAINDDRQQVESGLGSNLRTLLMVIGLSSIFGIALASLAMWRTSVAAKRTRQIRSARSGSPDSILKSIQQLSGTDLSIQNLQDKETSE